MKTTKNNSGQNWQPICLYEHAWVREISYNLTTIGFQQSFGDLDSIEPSCIVEGSKAFLVQSIDIDFSLFATLQKII